MDLVDTESLIADTLAPENATTAAPTKQERGARLALEDKEEARALGLYLKSLRSFFQLRNHPFSETEQPKIYERDWTNELRIVRRLLLESTQLALQLSAHGDAASNETLLDDAGGLDLPEEFAPSESVEAANTGAENDALCELAETLANATALCEAMLEARAVSLNVWSSFGKALANELAQSKVAERITRAADHHAAASLQPRFITLARHTVKPQALAADTLAIFTGLACMLERLRFIEKVLRRDQPLKPLLPIFALVHEEARCLVEFIETRAMRNEGIDDSMFDALDGTNYAISMELRKVFAHELVGLSAQRQAPAIYAKVENAHGLLRDCFQQSSVGLAQLFDPSLEGAQLFDAFQTKLEQSLALRKDLWTLLQLVRRAERERDQQLVAPLLKRLSEFRETSLRYLMYKDWEACERFMEEVDAARGAIELAPVLHRFGAYLETLHGQVNMRAVLAAHPFDYPQQEE